MPVGTYRYDPLIHALRPLPLSRGEEAEVVASLAESLAVQLPVTPAATFVFIATPARTACKYDDLALTTLMKDAGCLLQQFYLLTTALGLAGCAVGGGSPDTVERSLALEAGEYFVGGYVVW